MESQEERDRNIAVQIGEHSAKLTATAEKIKIAIHVLHWDGGLRLAGQEASDKVTEAMRLLNEAHSSVEYAAMMADRKTYAVIARGEEGAAD